MRPLCSIDPEKEKRKPNARRKLKNGNTRRNIKRTNPRIPHCLRERCLGPQARGQNTQPTLKGDHGHTLILIPVLPHLILTDRIDQSQTGDITHHILLKIHDHIPGPEVDLIPEVTQGLRGVFGQVEVDQGILLHSLDHYLVLSQDTGQGQEPDQTLDIERFIPERRIY